MSPAVIIAIMIAMGAQVASGSGEETNLALALIGTIAVVALAPVPGIVLAARVNPARLADPLTRGRTLRRIRIGYLVCQGYVLGSFAVITYALKWPMFVETGLHMRNWILLDELLRLAPYLCMQMLAWVPLYRVDHMLRRGTWTLPQYIEFNARHKLLLVLVPFTFMVAVRDILELLPWGNGLRAEGLDVLLSVVVLPVFFVFAPVAFRYIWKTCPLEDGVLRRQLTALCERAHMRCSDILIWMTMGGHIVNAAVTGIIPQVRYLLVTDALIESMNPEEIEGVFAHEIGHVKLHHMLYYVLCVLTFMAIIVLMDYVPMLLGMTVAPTDGAGDVWSEMTSPAGLSLIILVLLYWGVGFSFVSRRMECEADLYATELCGDAATFVDALERISLSSGRPRTANSWRHFSIGRRVDFLVAAEADPERRRRFRAGMLLMRMAIASLALLTAAAAVTVLVLVEHGTG